MILTPPLSDAGRCLHAQIGQAERDRRKTERMETERKHMRLLALKEAELSRPVDPVEAATDAEPDVKWGERSRVEIYFINNI